MEKESIYKKREEQRKETKDSFLVFSEENIRKQIQQHADKRGEDVNEFCKRAIETTMELDKTIVIPQKVPKETKRRIRVRFEKGEKQRIKEHTKKTEESMNDFIYRSMITVMELDDAMEEMEGWDTKNGKG